MKVWKIEGDCVPDHLAYIAVPLTRKDLFEQLDWMLEHIESPHFPQLGTGDATTSFTVSIAEMTEDEYNSLVADY